MSDQESMHEYQDNGSPGIPDFARRFIQAHFDFRLDGKDVEYLPIPGNKPMLGLAQLACGAAQQQYHHRHDGQTRLSDAGRLVEVSPPETIFFTFKYGKQISFQTGGY